MFKSKKTPLDVIQSTSRSPRIDEHIRKVDLSFLDYENRIKETQDIVFCHNTLTCETASHVSVPKNHILGLLDPILMI